VPTIDFPPWLQTALTIGFVGLVVLHQLGRYLLIKDPASEWGARLVVLGIGLQALRRHPASRLLPPMPRAVLDSLTDSEPPGSVALCERTPDCTRVVAHSGQCIVIRGVK
jgi:hypothetical protein